MDHICISVCKFLMAGRIPEWINFPKYFRCLQDLSQHVQIDHYECLANTGCEMCKPQFVDHAMLTVSSTVS